MQPLKIESSTAEERRTWIKETFRCKADCDNCGLCKVYGGRDMEEVYSEYIVGSKSFEEWQRKTDDCNHEKTCFNFLENN